MFVHLHAHFTGSYSDSTLRIDEALAQVKRLGQPGIAITDHGSLAKIYEFYYKARRLGLKPIIGCECYFVDDAKYNIENQINHRYHIVLLAKNNQGLQNLIKIVNYSWEKNCFQNRIGLVDWALLEKYSKGLIALSACLFGRVQQEYIHYGLESAEAVATRLRNIFDEDFYLELSRHGLEDEEKANEGQIKIGEKLGIPLVVTNDVHYLRKEDWRVHDMVIKTRFGKVTDFKLDSREYWLKSEAEMLALGFPKQYLENSVRIFEKIDLSIESMQGFSPRFFFGLKESIIDVNKARKIVKDVIHTEDEIAELLLTDIPREALPNFDAVLRGPRQLIPIRTFYTLPYSQINGEYLGRILPPAAVQAVETELSAFLTEEQQLVYYYIRNENAKFHELLKQIKPPFKYEHTYFFAGVVAYKLGLSDESKTYFLEYVERQKDRRRHARAYYFLGFIENDYRYFLMGIVANPYYELNYYGIGVVLYHSGKENAARRYLEYFVQNTSITSKKNKAYYLLRKIKARS